MVKFRALPRTSSERPPTAQAAFGSLLHPRKAAVAVRLLPAAVAATSLTWLLAHPFGAHAIARAIPRQLPQPLVAMAPGPASDCWSSSKAEARCVQAT